MATPTAEKPSSSPDRRAWHSSVAPGVFYPSLAILVTVVLVSIAFPDRTGEVLASAQSNVVSGIGWYYTLAVTGFVVFAVWMGISRFGDITLGNLAEIYGVSIGADKAQLTLADYFDITLDHAPRVNDTMPIGEIVLVARAISGGRVNVVGLRLPEDAA